MVTWAEQKKKTRDKVVKERSEIVLFVYLFVYSLSLSLSRDAHKIILTERIFKVHHFTHK
jgi:hypothetical protein